VVEPLSATPSSPSASSNHIWSFAGNEQRQDISATFLQPFVAYTTKTYTTVGLNTDSATFLQPFVAYTTKTYTTVGLNTESTYDWKNKQWTVPINVSVSQLLKLAGQPIQLSLGGRYYAERPMGGPDWGIRFTVTVLFPK
jgi:hypothetical protein